MFNSLPIPRCRAAAAGSKAVVVCYEDLHPALFTIEDAIAADSYFDWSGHDAIIDGDVDAAFAMEGVQVCLRVSLHLCLCLCKRAYLCRLVHAGVGGHRPVWRTRAFLPRVPRVPVCARGGFGVYTSHIFHTSARSMEYLDRVLGLIRSVGRRYTAARRWLPQRWACP